MSKPLSAAQRMAAEGFANVEEARRFLGIGKTNLYALVRAGVISHARIGGRIVLPWVAIKEYAAIQTRLGKVA